ncbi:MAG: hypothetical protein QME57_01485 [Patescibacteria group bacterium]|nr:hypothetical protein [Patescibacteria group bacterium]
MIEKFERIIRRFTAIVMILSLLAMNMPVANAATRLTGAKDTLSTIQASGTGSAVAGYTESTQSITDDFIIVDTKNDVICMNTAGGTASSTCAGPDDVKVDLITHGGAVSGNHYTGDQLAAIIATALAAADGDADDSYTVTYAESTNLFSIRADGGNTLNPSLAWKTYTGSDSAAATLGYTADDTAIRDNTAISDSAVAFNVIAGSNDSFSISVNGEPTVSVTIAQGVYSTSTLVSEMDSKIDAASTDNVTVSYTSSNKFRITSDLTGAHSSIVVTEGTNDFLRTVRLVGDVPVNGREARGLVSADHTIVFTLAEPIAGGDTINITFPSGFGLTGIDFEDVDMSGSITGEIPLAATASGITWGVAVSGQVLTLTSDTGTTTEETITIEIGRHATAGVTGTEQITNPTTPGLYQITIEHKTGDTVKQDARIAVYIVSDDVIAVQATIDPILSFAIQGGNLLDFGTLEPNAYHKLGGARSAYGSISLTDVAINAALDTETVTVRGIVYEFSNDGVASGTNKVVSIVDNENNYLTAAQVASNLYRAINNNDGDLVRANVDAETPTVVNVIAVHPGTIGNDYTLAETVTDANFTVSGAKFTGGALGYNRKATSIAYATGSDVGNGQTGTNIVVSTNAAGGYVITIQNTDTNGVNNNSDGMTNGTVEIPEWKTGTYGYGVLASAQSARYGDGTSKIIASAFRGKGDASTDLPEEMSTTPVTLASYAGPAANDNIAIEYNIRIDASQAAGQYSDMITYITTSTY